MWHAGRDLWQRILLFLLFWIPEERVAVAGGWLEGYDLQRPTDGSWSGDTAAIKYQPDDKGHCGFLY
jgi:hypothetical protein